jgi:uncharacterized membrane protein (UPF0127 family)
MSVGRAIVARVREVALRDPRDGRWRVEVPTGLRERMRGLIGRDRLEPGRALLLPRTRSIHTFGMRFTASVALLDARFRVIAVRTVAPNRIVLPRRGVRHVLECGPGADLRPGDVLGLGGRASEEKGADHEIDGQGDQGQRNRKDQDGPSGPSREGHRFTSGPVGRDDPQELQQRPHTTSSANDIPS